MAMFILLKWIKQKKEIGTTGVFPVAVVTVCKMNRVEGILLSTQYPAPSFINTALFKISQIY